MKKRSKIQVEIRNLLSEILIDTLNDTGEIYLLHIISYFCGLIEETGRKTFTLEELLIFSTDLGIDRNKILNNSLFLNMFDMDSEENIRIKKRYENHLKDICERVGSYLNFISNIYAQKRKLGSGIKGVVQRGALLFNEGFYFESHEFLEEVWRETEGRGKDFLKALIHLAVAFYHLEFENPKGLMSYLERSRSRLRKFEPEFLGVDVKMLLDDIERYLKFLESYSGSSVFISRHINPEIKFVER